MRRAFTALLAAGLLSGFPVGASATGVSATSPDSGCEVTSGELTWGFKETFRAYIDGSIANGEWTVADGATYATPTFGFPATDGVIDPRDPAGSVAFAGSVRFTGHGEILDTTLSNPVLVVRADGTGMLLLDVSGATMAGDPVEVREAPFAEIDLAGQNLTPVDDVITIDTAPTSLTAQGEAAFPNYPAGESFDPVTVTMEVGDCALTGEPIGEQGPLGNATVWMTLIVGLVVLLAAVPVVVFAVRRRR